MITNIEGPKEVKQEIFASMRAKMDKLETFFDRIERADVFLKEEKKDAAKGKIVEIKLVVPGPDLFTIGMSDTYMKAFGISFKKMKKLLNEEKDNRWAPDYQKAFKEL